MPTVRTRRVAHTLHGLRYWVEPEFRLSNGRRAWELVEHPGWIERVGEPRDGASICFVGVCAECNEQFTRGHFTLAVQALKEHIDKHAVEQAGLTIGYRIEYGHGWRRAVCAHQSCDWHSAWYVTGRGNQPSFDKVIQRHLDSHIARPTPANITRNPSKEKSMPVIRPLSAVEREITFAQARLDGLLEERDRLAKRPAEPTEKLITFGIRFPGNSTVYQYAARKARGLWWVTGREGGTGRSWEEMLEFLSQDADVQAGKPIRFRAFSSSAGTVIRGQA